MLFVGADENRRIGRSCGDIRDDVAPCTRRLSERRDPLFAWNTHATRDAKAERRRPIRAWTAQTDVQRFDRPIESPHIPREPFARCGIERLFEKVVPHFAEHVFFGHQKMLQPLLRRAVQVHRDLALGACQMFGADPKRRIWHDPVEQPFAQAIRPPRPNIHLRQSRPVLAQIGLKTRARGAVRTNLKNYIQATDLLLLHRASARRFARLSDSNGPE